jgi:Glycosyl hydrolase family 20, catalytic domain/beta-acetyl hexosaminidase like
MILPLPTRADLRTERRVLPRALRCEGPSAARVERAAQRLLGVSSSDASEMTVVTWESATAVPQAGQDERYSLKVDASGIVIQAHSIWGALHGLTTLALLGTSEGVPLGHVEDGPRFSWRGLMLDPARRFLPIPLLQRVIDGMAWLKLNVLHLHLTDDQGFRFQSQRFPKLASAEHYTQAELVDFVGYAADRGVRVIPELDMPGHVTSWLTAYPEWGAGEAPTSVRFGVHPGCLNPADERVYRAIEALLTEVAAVFPDEYIHLGGDEVHSSWWRDHAGVQAFMAQQGIADSAALQASFNRRVVASLSRLGRQAIGWDEVLHTQMPPNLLVQSWRGATARDRALDAGHDCIVSSGFYLDLFYPGAVHGQYDPTAPEIELLAQEDALLIDPRFEHVAGGMRWTHAWRNASPVGNGASRGKVVGAEACLWGELVDRQCLSGRLWSRLPAIAELLWSATPDTDDPLPLFARSPAFIKAELAEQRQHLATIMADEVALEMIELCEPVKWYARLLGEVALNARLRGSEMPQARPYTTQTRLDRAIDFLLPESLAARAVKDMPTGELVLACRRWCAFKGANRVPEEVLPVVHAIAEGAQTMLEHLAGRLSHEDTRSQLMQRFRPYGEYIPAVLLVLAERLQ